MIPINYFKNIEKIYSLIDKYGIDLKLVGERKLVGGGIKNGFVPSQDSFDLKHIKDNILNAKIFMLDKYLSKCLCNTNNSYHSQRLPFQSIFIECCIPVLDTNIIGLLIFEDIDGIYKNNLLIRKHLFCFYETLENVPAGYDNYICLTFPFDKENDNKEDYEEIKRTGWTINHSSEIRKYLINFLDFLNNQEIELITIERTKEQNLKRIKRGKQPIPTIHNIRVTGKLKIYLDQLKSNANFKYSHRFDVRGHVRRLRSEKWGDKQGTTIWILPYIKGDGIYIKKNYEVKDEN